MDMGSHMLAGQLQTRPKSPTPPQDTVLLSLVLAVLAAPPPQGRPSSIPTPPASSLPVGFSSTVPLGRLTAEVPMASATLSAQEPWPVSPVALPGICSRALEASCGCFSSIPCVLSVPGGWGCVLLCCLVSGLQLVPASRWWSASEPQRPESSEEGLSGGRISPPTSRTGGCLCKVRPEV